MDDSQADRKIGEVDLAIALAETALAHCDKAGLVFPAIDISSALDKLRIERDRLTMT